MPEDDRTAKIVIIDDSSLHIKMIESRLGGEYEVHSATTPMKAISLICDVRPHLVLIDYEMPTMNGIELAKELKKNDLTSHYPLIMLTSKEDEELIVHAFDGGVDDFISKGAPEKIFQARVRAQLRAEERKQDLYQKIRATLNHEMNNSLMGLSASVKKVEKTCLKSEILEPEILSNIERLKSSVSSLQDIVVKFSNLDQLYETEYMGEVRMIDIHRMCQKKKSA